MTEIRSKIESAVKAAEAALENAEAGQAEALNTQKWQDEAVKTWNRAIHQRFNTLKTLKELLK